MPDSGILEKGKRVGIPLYLLPKEIIRKARVLNP